MEHSEAVKEDDDTAAIKQAKRTFRKRLRDLRHERFRTAAAFAEACGLPLGNINAWEGTRNVTPPIYRIPALCRALGVSADYLLGITDTPTPAAAPSNTINGNGNIGTTTNANCRDCAALAALAATIRDLSSRLTP